MITQLGNPNYEKALARARAALQYRPPPFEVIELMWQWRNEGMPLRAIAEKLNSLSIRTPQSAVWYPANVRAALVRNDPSAYESSLKTNRTETTPSFIGSSTGREPIKEGGMPMPSDYTQALRMMDLFASVGATSYVITKTDIEQRLIWGKTYSAVELREKLPAMVRTAEIRRPHHLSEGTTAMAGENLIVRPTGSETVFVQLDDLSAEQLERVRPAAFLIHATSPGNHQAWIAISHVDKNTSKDVIRRVRRAIGDVDKSASGATRIGGTFNWKPKNLPEPPLVTIIHGVPGRLMTLDRLEAMGLLADPEPVKAMPAPARVSTKSDRAWPSYEKALAGAPPNKSGNGPDRSQADYWFAYLSAQWGHSVEDITSKLLEVSANSRERAVRGDEGYAVITAQNAAAAAARGRQRGRV